VVFFGFVGNGQVAVVDQEDISTSFLVDRVGGATHIDIEESVDVDIDHRYAGLRADLTRGTHPFGNIPVLTVAVVQIEFVAEQVGRKIDVDQAIVINISQRDAATVVEILVCKNIASFSLVVFIDEADAGVAFAQAGKKVIILRSAGNHQ